MPDFIKGLSTYYVSLHCGTECLLCQTALWDWTPIISDSNVRLNAYYVRLHLGTECLLCHTTLRDWMPIMSDCMWGLNAYNFRLHWVTERLLCQIALRDWTPIMSDCIKELYAILDCAMSKLMQLSVPDHCHFILPFNPFSWWTFLSFYIEWVRINHFNHQNAMHWGTEC